MAQRDLAKKNVDLCLLCEEPGKGKRFTFFSGVCKGGSTTQLLSATVTVFERWRDLKIYEIHVCRECQQRLWAGRPNWTPLAAGAGAGVVLLLALGCLLVSPIAGLVIGMLALALAGAAVGFWFLHRSQKPVRAQLERLVVLAAIEVLPNDDNEDHTFLTNDQYLELVERGILG
jgi:hypothetical protein